MPNVLEVARDTFDELLRMHQLNLELLEQLNVACGWIMANHVEVPNKEKIGSLLNKVVTLLDEIHAKEPKMIQYQKLSDEFSQKKPSDADYTEPQKEQNI